MGCGSHFGGKARLVGFCVGVGLVSALCGAWVCAGKRAWLVLAGLHGTPPRFPSCLTLLSHPPVSASSFTHRAFPPVSASSFTRRAFLPVSPATLSLQSFPPLSLSSLAHSAHPQPLHFKVFLACVRPTLLSLNILPKCPAFRAMQDIYLTDCDSGFYVLS